MCPARYSSAPYSAKSVRNFPLSKHEDNVAQAQRLQEIRADYEEGGFKEMLWADCLEMGFEPSKIREFETDPAAITSCLYVGQGMKPPVDHAKLYIKLP